MKYCFRSQKKSKKKKKWIWGVIFGSIFVLGGLFVIFYSPLFRFTQIQLSPASTVSDSEIQSFIETYFRQWGSQSLFLSFGSLEEKILSHFPTIEKVSLRRRLPHTLIITLTERKPILQARLADSTFLIDKNGFVFQKNSPQDNLPILEVEVSSCQKPRVGEFLLPSAPWENLSSIILYFWEKKESLSFVQGRLVSPKQMNIILSPGPVIYFDLEEEGSYSLQAIDAFSQQEDFLDWKYLDLRSPNRAFYLE